MEGQVFIYRFVFILIIFFQPYYSLAEINKTSFLKFYCGFPSTLDDNYSQLAITSVGDVAVASSTFSNGWAAGASIGKFITNNFSYELALESRLNDIDAVSFSDGSIFTEGNFSSNIWFINGYYYFDNLKVQNFSPYFGAGLGYAVGVDLYLEHSGSRLLFSTGDKFMGQFIFGAYLPIDDDLKLDVSVRYLNLNDLELSQVSSLGRLSKLSYKNYAIIFGTHITF